MKPIFVSFCKWVVIPITSLFTKKIEGVENIPPGGSFIIVPNHNNGLDHCFIGMLLKERLKDLRFIAAMDNLRTVFLSGIFYYLSEAIIINRKKIKRGKALEKMLENIKKGKVIVIYPEGDSNHKRTLLRGKTGAAELAVESGTPLIPVGLDSIPGSWKRIVRIGKPLFFSKKEGKSKQTKDNQKDYYITLRKITDEIMKKISQLSKKPYPYGN